MERWRGRFALVTGASTEIGAAVTTALLRSGLTVVGVAPFPERVYPAVKRGAHSGTVIAMYGDVRNEAGMMAVFDRIRDELGCVHVVVNTAGIYRDAPTGAEFEELESSLDAKLLGLSVCSREAIKLMAEQEINDGHIIHIRSAIAWNLPVKSKDSLPVATKQSVDNLVEGLRRDLARQDSKTKVTVVSPGVVDTDVFDEFRTLTRDEPYLRPADVADAVLSALSTPRHVQVKEIVLDAVGQAAPSEW